MHAGVAPSRKDSLLKETKKIESIRTVAATLFAQRGFNAVGVAELGEATGLGRGALYHHIESKEDLLYDISSRYMTELIDEARTIAAHELDPIERIKKLSRHMISVVCAHLPEMTVCFREVHALSGERNRIVNQLHLDYQQIWSDAIDLGVAQGVFRPIEKVAIKAIMGMYFYSFLWINPKGRQSAGEIGDIFSDLILASLTTAGANAPA